MSAQMIPVGGGALVNPAHVALAEWCRDRVTLTLYLTVYCPYRDGGGVSCSRVSLRGDEATAAWGLLGANSAPAAAPDAVPDEVAASLEERMLAIQRGVLEQLTRIAANCRTPR